MSIPPQKKCSKWKVPNHDYRMLLFALTARDQKNLKHRVPTIQHDLHEDNWDSCVDTSSNFGICGEAFDDVEEGCFVDERLTEAGDCHWSCVYPRTPEFGGRVLWVMAMGGDLVSLPWTGQGLAFCTIGVEKERLLFDQLWFHVNVVSCALCPLMLMLTSVFKLKLQVSGCLVNDAVISCGLLPAHSSSRFL